MDVKISLLWMLEGKGILRACKASGVRGFVDRRSEITYYQNVSSLSPHAYPSTHFLPTFMILFHFPLCTFLFLLLL